MFKLFLAALFLSSFALNAFAEGHLKLKTAVIEGYFITGGGSSYSTIASWRPTFYNLKGFDLGLSLGAAPIKQDSGAITSLYEGFVFAGYKIHEQIQLQLDIGGQYWGSNDEGAGFLAGISGKYELNENLKSKLRYIDFVTVGYSYIDQSESFHMVRIGVGKSF